MKSFFLQRIMTAIFLLIYKIVSHYMVEGSTNHFQKKMSKFKILSQPLGILAYFFSENNKQDNPLLVIDAQRWFMVLQLFGKNKES